MRRVCALAAERGVRVGEHVSYRDLACFGRRDLDVDPHELRDEVTYQIAGLDGMANAVGTAVRYVKAHGALYNRAAHDETHARALVEGVHAYDPQLPILGLPGTVVLEIAAAAGSPVVAEGFPDRAYTAHGRLVPRTAADSVLTDPEEVAHRAVRMALHGDVIAQTGGGRRPGHALPVPARRHPRGRHPGPAHSRRVACGRRCTGGLRMKRSLPGGALLDSTQTPQRPKDSA